MKCWRVVSRNFRESCREGRNESLLAKGLRNMADEGECPYSVRGTSVSQIFAKSFDERCTVVMQNDRGFFVVSSWTYSSWTISLKDSNH